MLLQIKKLFLYAILFAALSLASSSVHAQKNDPPSGQFGLGVYAAEDFACGAEGVYAISPNLQVGSLLSFSIRSNGAYNGSGSSSFILGPFARFIMDSKVSPFLEGRFMLFAGSGKPNEGIFLGGGLAYYLNHEIGVHAGIDVINLYFSPSSSKFGLTSFLAGADWFF